MKKYNDINIIPHTNRGYFCYFVNKSKIFVKEGNVVASSVNEDIIHIYNIPYVNTNILILTYGTSISNEAIIKLSHSNTLILTVSNNYNLHSIIYPENKGQNTKYPNKLINHLFINNKRLTLAKNLLINREKFNNNIFNKIHKDIFDESFNEQNINIPSFDLNNATTIEELLGYEGNYNKKLIDFFKKIYIIPFIIEKEKNNLKKNMNKDILDKDEYINNNLDKYEKELYFKIKQRYEIGNNLCYGTASIVLHSLNIPLFLNILHGRTNHNSLKYDIADIIKGIVLQTSVLSFIKNTDFYSDTPEEYIQKLSLFFNNNNILKILFDNTILSLDLKE